MKIDPKNVQYDVCSTLASYEITAIHIPTGHRVSRKYGATRPGKTNMRKSMLAELQQVIDNDDTTTTPK